VIGYYDATDSASITRDGSNFVSQWSDQGGVNHLTGSGSTKPLYSATGYTDGGPCIYFDNFYDKQLISGSITMGVDDFAAGIGMKNVNLNMRCVSFRGVGESFDTNNVASAGMIMGLSGGMTGYRVSAAKGSVSLSTNETNAFVSNWDGANHTMYKNGTAGTSAASTGNLGATGAFRLGYGDDSGLEMYVRRLCLVKRSLTGTEITNLDLWLRAAS